MMINSNSCITYLTVTLTFLNGTILTGPNNPDAGKGLKPNSRGKFPGD